jgi:hypothetical protein
MTKLTHATSGCAPGGAENLAQASSDGQRQAGRRSLTPATVLAALWGGRSGTGVDLVHSAGVDN